MEIRILLLFSLIVIINNVNTAPKTNILGSIGSKKLNLKKLSESKIKSLRQHNTPNLGSDGNEDQVIYSDEENLDSAEDVGSASGLGSDETEEQPLDLESNDGENDAVNEEDDESGSDDDEISENDDEETENNDNDSDDDASEDTDDKSKDDEANSDYDNSGSYDDGSPRLQLMRPLNGKPRSVMAGDTFTPSEMLPITQKLLAKVDNPGLGKGIVSSAKNPQLLADRIFEAFFFTPKRIVTLQDFDISGLDALQALALSGEPAGRSRVHSMTEPPSHGFVNVRGQYVRANIGPKRCHYKLVTKKVNIARKKPKKTKRQAKKLAKKRRLVVKAGVKARDSETTKKPRKPSRVRVKNRVKKRSKKPVIVRHKNWKTKVLRTNRNKGSANRGQEIKKSKESKGKIEKSKSACNWHYQCDDVTNLDTCRLHTKCTNANIHEGVNKVRRDEDERNFNLKQFRKMLGISIVDEEVEKILENRIMHLKPGSTYNGERYETLTEYFNGLIMAEHMKTTTPKSPAIIELSTQKRKVDLPEELSDDYNEAEHSVPHNSSVKRRRAGRASSKATPKKTKKN